MQLIHPIAGTGRLNPADPTQGIYPGQPVHPRD